MLSTGQLRLAWAPPCFGPRARVTLYGGAVVSVRPSTVEANLALSKCFEHHDYRATPPDCGAQNCRHITGGTGYSLHSYGIADDINWQDNPYGPRLITDMPMALIADIKAVRTKNGKQVWGWGGDYSGNKDAMHFEIVCSPSDLATGLDPKTIPGGNPVVNTGDDDVANTAAELELAAEAGATKALIKAGLMAKGPDPTDSVLVKKLRGVRDTILAALPK